MIAVLLLTMPLLTTMAMARWIRCRYLTSASRGILAERSAERLWARKFLLESAQRRRSGWRRAERRHAALDLSDQSNPSLWHFVLGRYDIHLG